MSEADKIIESLKNSGRKVEEFYTGNKTSDKNVGSIEEDVKYVKEMLEIARVFFKIVKAETDYKDVEEVAFCKAIEHILAELEQKDKRIQKLEEESEILEFQNKQVENYAEELKKYNKTVSDRMVEYKKNSIPKQAVIDLIKKETIDISGFECIAVEDLEKIIGG